MELKEQRDSCPHCGGVNGWTTKIVYQAVRVHGWKGEDFDTDGYVVKSETDPRCMDCEKPIRSLVK
jgi:hypothetical protein